MAILALRSGGFPYTQNTQLRGAQKFWGAEFLKKKKKLNKKINRERNERYTYVKKFLGANSWNACGRVTIKSATGI